MRHIASLLIAGAALAGCTTMSGYPEAAFDHKEARAELAPFLKASAVADYDKCADKLACRNMLVDARVRAVDLLFYRFLRRLHGQQAGLSVGGSLLSSSIDSLATFTSAGPLAAGGSAISGGRNAYEKQVFGASMPLLIEQMMLKRRIALLKIRRGQQLPVANYSLFTALNDISEYELAGSIPMTAADLAATAGTSARHAQDELDKLRATAFVAPTVAAVPMPPVAPAPAPTPLATPSPSPVASTAPATPPKS